MVAVHSHTFQSVVVPVGADGNVRGYNNVGSTHVIFDVMGWFSA